MISTPDIPTVKILGSRVHLVDMPRIMQAVQGWIDAPDGRCHRITVTGFHGLWEAHRRPDFKAVLNSADLWVPDGIAPVWIARLRGHKKPCRTPGADIMKAFFALANARGYSSYFYGDTDDTLARLREKLQADYPGHRVAGTFSPPFRPIGPEEDAQIIDTINSARPDVLWVGLGLPKQDRWIFDHLDRLKVPVAIGVGAAFGFLSGKVKRVPGWIGNHGLEWAWRLATEPKKIWRRVLLDGPRFTGHVLLEMTGLRKYD